MRFRDRIFLALTCAAAVNLVALPLETSAVGELLLLPGVMLEGFIELMGTVLLSSNNDYFMLPPAGSLVLNMVFYSVILWLASWLWRPNTNTNKHSGVSIEEY